MKFKFTVIKKNQIFFKKDRGYLPKNVPPAASLKIIN